MLTRLQRPFPRYRKCDCPKYVHGVPEGGGTMIRKTARTNSWSVAEKLARKMDADSLARRLGRKPEDQPQKIEVGDALKQFVASKDKENSAAATLDSYAAILLRQFLPWCQRRGVNYIDQVTSEVLTDVSELWEKGKRWCRDDEGTGNRSSTARIKYTRLNSFMSYGVSRGWWSVNPLKAAFRRPKLVKGHVRETQPLTQQELRAMVIVTYASMRGSNKGSDEGQQHRTKMRALLLLMRYSGMAVVDAVSLERCRLVRPGPCQMRQWRLTAPKRASQSTWYCRSEWQNCCVRWLTRVMSAISFGMASAAPKAMSLMK